MNKNFSIQFWIVFVFISIILFSQTGCNDSGNITQTIYSNVSGMVVDDYGNPVEGCIISYQGDVPQTYTTGDDGTFSIRKVIRPYDLYLIKGRTAVVYKNVLSTSPLLNTFCVESHAPQVATIHMYVPGVHFNQVLAVWFADTTGRYQGDTEVMASSNATYSVKWSGINVCSGKIMAMIYTLDNNMLPVSYDCYGEKAINLIGGANYNINFTSDDIKTDPGETRVNLNIIKPSWSDEVQNSFYISTKTFANYRVRGFHLIGADFEGEYNSIVVPVNGKIFYYYLNSSATDEKQTSSKISPVQAGDNTITLTNPPVMLSPFDGATGVNYHTAFDFYSDVADGVYRTVIESDSTDYFVNILSKAPDATIPDLTSLGFKPDVQKTYSWKIIKYSNLNNIDDFVLSWFAFNELVKSIVVSEKRTFTFSPTP